jgi:hypothetical protein
MTASTALPLPKDWPSITPPSTNRDDPPSNSRPPAAAEQVASSPGRAAAQAVVRLSLEREPKASILRSLDLTVIGRTFPARRTRSGWRSVGRGPGADCIPLPSAACGAPQINCKSDHREH